MLTIITNKEEVEWHVGESIFLGRSLLSTVTSLIMDGDELIHIINTCPIDIVPKGKVVRLVGVFAQQALANIR